LCDFIVLFPLLELIIAIITILMGWWFFLGLENRNGDWNQHFPGPLLLQTGAW